MFRIPFLGSKPLIDLNGKWMGRYNYDSDNGFGTFTLNLTEQDARIAGRIKEPNTFQGGGAPTFDAIIFGYRKRNRIDFTKRYDGKTAPHDSDILYTGRFIPDKDLITGQWLMPDVKDWGGRFEMTRAPQTTIFD